MRSLRTLAAALALVVLTGGSLALPQEAIGASIASQASPQFRLGFKALADQVPGVVGTPLEEEHWGANGDSLQQTTTGLMAWRKADNWTAFTNGSRTWVDGPYGVMQRGNEERFPWEASPVSQQSDASEITVWDRRSSAIAYISVADEYTIYLWTGEPVAYLLGDNVFGFNGRHLGWFQDGIIWDYEGVAVGFTRQAPYVAQNSEPPKMSRHPLPARAPREATPAQPPLTLGVYTDLLLNRLRMGLVQ